MDALIFAVLGLVVGAIVGRYTAPKPEAAASAPAGGGDSGRLKAELAESERARKALEAEVARLGAAAPAPAAAAPAPAPGGDAELLAAENAALKAALSKAEARAATAAMG